ncbi:GH3 auxin-responsive promoter family protein [Flavobacteriaceae bacterium TP-CH-4]|uniref:GH3 auxin-responsive promoter family protein n=1 Tax=Pelagihabitans pacificus TaxID=2696054 RepID=A0A967B0T5_9FLAO|nr:GH3 auxin-responsive promoter family protein [Pelagihabitans pacificus]NHF61032.1 GH3 auxin-responsive promoter family protein [Pelagihabitans pacificus]
MPLLGELVKGVIHATDWVLPERNPIAEQEQVLKELLEKGRATEFGKRYKFDKILNSGNVKRTFVNTVPFFDYHKIDKEWWHRQHATSATDVTWPGDPNYYALSSGTTGKTSKRIPVTDAMIKAIQKAGIKQVLALRNFDLPPDFFEKGILMLGSSTDLVEQKNHLEGEISGISASNIPSWFRGYYKPGEQIAQIDDWDERVAKIVKEAPNWDIGALSGIPSWMELMLKEVIDAHNLENIHEIWPNLQVYTSGGVAFGPYEKSFNALMGKPITIIDTYLASEGFIAFQSRPETDAMQLITDNGIYFEFVPFDEDAIKEDGSLSENATALSLEEVKKDRDYVLVMSTVAGAWRYMIGDTIEFTDVERAEIRITGRTKFFLNTVGSQLSVNKLNNAVHHLEQKFDVQIPEYTLCAKKYEDGFYHSWYLGTEADVPLEKLSSSLDDFLKEANKNYKVARGKALQGVKVHTIHPEVFHEWSAEHKKKGGQVKMERVMGENKFAEWEDFLGKF